jgi:hypothetical protein
MFGGGRATQKQAPRSHKGGHRLCAVTSTDRVRDSRYGPRPAGATGKRCAGRAGKRLGGGPGNALSAGSGRVFAGAMRRICRRSLKEIAQIIERHGIFRVHGRKRH